MASVLLLARKRMASFCCAAVPFCRSSAIPLLQPPRNQLMGITGGFNPMLMLSSIPRGVHISFFSIYACSGHGGYRGMLLWTPPPLSSWAFQRMVTNNIFNIQQLQQVRFRTNALVTLNTDNDVIRFSLGKENANTGVQSKGRKKPKKQKMSRKAKLNELKWYRLKAKKKMKSPNPEVRIRYKLEKAKRKEEWLIEKLRKYEVPKTPEPIHDPEILTDEERFYLKRTGEKKKNYVPVGRRGVFGGVVLNMHLHWKKHETVKVVCKPCKPGQIHEYAEELARLSKGTVIDIKPNNIIIFYRGKNYVRPDVMLPPNTLSKEKALEKYRFEQSLDHTSQFIEKLEQELEEYHKYVALYKKRETTTDNIIRDDRD